MGGAFAGRSTRQGAVLLLTEEGADTIAEKARRFGIADHPDFHVITRRQVQASWPEVVRQARAYCREHRIAVAVVNTLDKWTGLQGENENAAGHQLEALDPLWPLTGDGLAILVVGHQRKSPGEHGEAVRGSNALTGAVDVVVEIERVKDAPQARAVHAVSRYASTPEVLAVELTEDDAYIARGDIDSLAQQMKSEKVLGVLSRDPMTSEEIADVTEIPDATVRRRLEDVRDQGLIQRSGEGKKGGLIQRSGEGKKGDPYRWSILPATTPTPRVAGRKTGGGDGRGER
jgi:hypothetical protein